MRRAAGYTRVRLRNGRAALLWCWAARLARLLPPFCRATLRGRRVALTYQRGYNIFLGVSCLDDILYAFFGSAWRRARGLMGRALRRYLPTTVPLPATAAERAARITATPAGWLYRERCALAGGQAHHLPPLRRVSSCRGVSSSASYALATGGRCRLPCRPAAHLLSAKTYTAFCALRRITRCCGAARCDGAARLYPAFASAHHYRCCAAAALRHCCARYTAPGAFCCALRPAAPPRASHCCVRAAAHAGTGWTLRHSGTLPARMQVNLVATLSAASGSVDPLGRRGIRTGGNIFAHLLRHIFDVRVGIGRTLAAVAGGGSFLSAVLIRAALHSRASVVALRQISAVAGVRKRISL